MSDFTKEELYQLSKAMEARLAFFSPSESPLYNKIQSMIDNYCEHDYRKALADSGMYYIMKCFNCNDSKPWSVLDDH